jgi:hypothetical protein
VRAVGIALGILAFGFVALTMVACEHRTGGLTGAPVPATRNAAAPASRAGGESVAHLKATGDELVRRGQPEQALQVYQTALRREPNDLGLRYAVAVTLSQLDRRAEAIAAFKWVLTNGLPDSEPVRRAESWLRDAGALSAPAQPIAVADRAPTSARLQGRVTWTDLDPGQAVPRVHLIIEGTDPSNKGKIYTAAAELNGGYDFPNVAPGAYRLTAQSRLVRLWELSVTILDGEPTILNLDQSSSVAPPSTFLARQ